MNTIVAWLINRWRNRNRGLVANRRMCGGAFRHRYGAPPHTRHLTEIII